MFTFWLKNYSMVGIQRRASVSASAVSKSRLVSISRFFGIGGISGTSLHDFKIQLIKDTMNREMSKRMDTESPDTWEQAR